MYVRDRIDALIGEIYSEDSIVRDARTRIHEVLRSSLSRLEAAGAFRSQSSPRRLDERDVFLITYGNTLGGGKGETPLAALRRFLRERLSGAVSYVHILPFFPYSSDDGFSVLDYRAVNPELGGWQDIRAIGQDFKPAFDLVINHSSSRGKWFQGFLRGDSGFEGWFLTRPEGYDASRVVRPRTHPLLTPFTRADGSRVYVWTTFSADQVDLDFSNPAVLAEMLDIFLGYVEKGARIIRMDAIAYLWKEDGHACLHHPKTHALVKLFRAVTDALGLDVLILTETNVPQEENLSYFGAGDEAEMVYNFSLPPLTLHAFTSGDAGCLSKWARETQAPPGCTFLNFLASHDGIGLTPAYGLVDEDSFRKTLDSALNRGCLISYKSTPAGPVPYELNASWFDAISDPALPEELRIKAHLASHALAASLEGMPAVYLHSFLGTGNWTEGPKLKGYNRAINRRSLNSEDVEKELENPSSRASRTLAGMKALYTCRGREPNLSPGVSSRVISGEGPVFAVLRGDGKQCLLCVVNVSPNAAAYSPGTELEGLFPSGPFFDPTSTGDKARPEAESGDGIRLGPYEVLWRSYSQP